MAAGRRRLGVTALGDDVAAPFTPAASFGNSSIGRPRNSSATLFRVAARAPPVPGSTTTSTAAGATLLGTGGIGRRTVAGISFGDFGGGGFDGFSMGNGKAVAVSAAAMRRAWALLWGGDSDGAVAPSISTAAMHTPASAPPGDFGGGGFDGFSTGNGKAVAVSAAGMRRAKALFGGDGDDGGGANAASAAAAMHTPAGPGRLLATL